MANDISINASYSLVRPCVGATSAQSRPHDSLVQSKLQPLAHVIFPSALTIEAILPLNTEIFSPPVLDFTNQQFASLSLSSESFLTGPSYDADSQSDLPRTDESTQIKYAGPQYAVQE